VDAANVAGGTGITVQSDDGDGIQASTRSSSKVGIFGRNNSTSGAAGPGGSGVFGLTLAPSGSGVFGANNAPAGTPGRGVQGNGAEAGVAGFSEHGTGVLAQSGHIGITAQAPVAGHFDGNVEVTGDVILANGGDVILANGDCAEDFDASIVEGIEPGTVMVIDDAGVLRESQDAYDRRVAGVVAGAGNLRPAIILDRHPEQTSRIPIALVGKTYCKVDAQHGPIAVGDLLTTASTPGHAMKADDLNKAFGAVIGKALRPLIAGCSLIPILISLQ